MSNILVIRPPAFLVAVLLTAHISTGHTLTKSTESSLRHAKKQIAEENHKPIWLTSDEMKRRATKKVDVGRLLKNADVKATVVASVIVGKDGDVECLKIINPEHPLIVSEVDKALWRWRFQPMERHGKPVGYLGWLEFRICNILCDDGKSGITLLN